MKLKKLILVLALLVCASGLDSCARQAAQEAQSPAQVQAEGPVLCGFRLIEERDIPEIESKALLFEHEKTGLELIKYENEDSNRAFTIFFKTPSTGDMGIQHVLEHTVLVGGSRKYPVKNLVMELIKGSMASFINGLTFRDLTFYPIASPNEKDFFNLMDVYMDMVFYPRMLDDPRIFEQEGWHYELENSDSALKISGVVYGEMKGAYSSPDRLMGWTAFRELFPGSPYHFSSGGHPDYIPDLTREELVAFHQKYYHPSNGYIVLWGDGDTKKELEFIDGKYLGGFEKKEVPDPYNEVPAFKKIKEVESSYPIAANEDPAGKTSLGLYWVTGGSGHPTESYAWEVLADVLVNRPAAPLRKALMNAGIGKDVSASYEDIKQGVFEIVVKNAEAADKDRFRSTVLETLAGLAEKGLVKEQVEGVINRHEFRAREADFGSFPAGIVYAHLGKLAWMHADKPFARVAFDIHIKALREGLKGRYFEELFQKGLVENNFGVLVTVTPEPGLEDRNREKVEKKLAEKKASLAQKEIDSIAARTKELREWQAMPETPENLKKIPSLALSDIAPEEKAFDVKEKKIDDLKVLHYDIPTRGIVYARLMFDGRILDPDLIPYLSLLTEFLGQIDTENHGYQDLDTQLTLNTGGFDVYSTTYTDIENTDRYQPRVVVTSKALIPRLGKMAGLMDEIMNRSKFEDADRVGELLKKVLSRLERWARDSGNHLANKRLSARLLPGEAFEEKLLGLNSYGFVRKVLDEFEENPQILFEKLSDMAHKLFNRHNLILGIVCSEDDYAKIEEQLKPVLGRLPKEEHKTVMNLEKLDAPDEGLLSASKVQYVYRGANFRELGYEYNGRLNLVSRVLSREYLYKHIRVQNGAYGTWSFFSRDGIGMFASYRDPEFEKTLEVFDGAADFLKTFEPDEREMTRFIIGEIAQRDKPLTPRAEGYTAIAYELMNVTHEKRQKERDDILSAKPADIRALAPVVDDVVKKGKTTVYGNEEKLREKKDLLQELVEVLE